MLVQDNALEHSAAGEQSNAVDWEAVYRAELPRIYNFFRYRTGDSTAAEDLTATTFEKAWRARMRYRRNLGAFSTWLFSIARNVARDHLRRNRRPLLPLDELTEQADKRVAPDVAVEQEETIGQLARLLCELPTREAELIALKYGAGLTNRAIAQLTGLSESNVGTILHRTVQQLKQMWEMSS